MVLDHWQENCHVPNEDKALDSVYANERQNYKVVLKSSLNNVDEVVQTELASREIALMVAGSVCV